MEMNELFINVTRRQYRFPYNGVSDVENMWSLDQEHLAGVLMKLAAQHGEKNAEKEQLAKFFADGDNVLEKKKQEVKILEEKIGIISYMIDVKKKEQATFRQELENKAEQAMINQIRVKKKEEDLMKKSEEELDQRMAELWKQ